MTYRLLAIIKDFPGSFRSANPLQVNGFEKIRYRWTVERQVSKYGRAVPGDHEMKFGHRSMQVVDLLYPVDLSTQQGPKRLTSAWTPNGRWRSARLCSTFFCFYFRNFRYSMDGRPSTLMHGWPFGHWPYSSKLKRREDGLLAKLSWAINNWRLSGRKKSIMVFSAFGRVGAFLPSKWPHHDCWWWEWFDDSSVEVGPSTDITDQDSLYVSST